MPLKILIGKKLEKIILNDKKTKLEITADGKEYKFGVRGDCCSESWIEYLTVPKNSINSRIMSVKNSELVSNKKDKKHCKRCGQSDHLQVYQTLINTERGTIVLEYRNDSNGYYGGYIVVAK